MQLAPVVIALKELSSQPPLRFSTETGVTHKDADHSNASHDPQVPIQTLDKHFLKPYSTNTRWIESCSD
jgi:hypothetical protein